MWLTIDKLFWTLAPPGYTNYRTALVSKRFISFLDAESKYASGNQANPNVHRGL
jgi:hypothetical protein